MAFQIICSFAAKHSMYFHEILGIRVDLHRSFRHLRLLLTEFTDCLDFDTAFLGSVIAGILITSVLICLSSYADLKRSRLLAQATKKLREEEFAEELHLQEALWALFTSKTSPHSNYDKKARETCESSKTTCQICFESKERYEMFVNKTCPHSFCYNCTRQHIVSNVQAKKGRIPCPQFRCKATLDSNTCRRIIPKDILIMWDEFLCLSLFSESEIFYCPFNDCSAFLLNDSGQFLTKITCPVCRRMFCVSCKVPWHQEFSCGEYKKLNAIKRGKEDEMARELARKKSWRQCDKCKYYVEKTLGCLHIVCRCGYEFCYKCGAKWSRHECS